MKNKSVLIYICIVIIALAFRLPGLSVRTMHGDEAVNAMKYIQLLEKGDYAYNPNEYHGPSLYYLTLPLSILISQNTSQELTEYTLRIVPVIFYLGLLLLLLIIKDRTGWSALLFSALLLSISPIFVYYSRYYIHEMLFVFFSYATLFSAIKCFEKQTVMWAFLSGLFMAFMLATKETWLIMFLSLFLSLAILVIAYPEFRLKFIKRLRALPVKVYITFTFSFVALYALMLTSFFQNPSGFWDSIVAISFYWDKSANNLVHGHPWYQYFKWLLFSSTESALWSEGIIAILAVSGGFFSFKTKLRYQFKHLFFIRLIALFTFIASAIYSVILYKTPWNALSFWFGMIILAGYGFFVILENFKNKGTKNLFIIIISIAVMQLAWQSYQLNFNKYESPDNPYVYAHPLKDIFRIIKPLREITEKHPDKKDMYIQVIVSDNDYWPLPWYLREFKNVGWWSRVDMHIPSADFIIAGPEMEEHLAHKFYEITIPGKRQLYIPLLPDYIDLRPGRKLQAFVTLKTGDLINL